MSLVKDPIGRARKAKTQLQAARLHLELESELGLNEDVPSGWEEEADQAIHMLEQRAGEEGWGDLRDVHVGGEGTKGWTPSLSAGARRGESAGDAPAATPRQPAPARRARARSARRRLAAARSYTSYAANVPGFASGRQIASAALWGGLGLVLLYLVLSDAENPSRGWPSAVQTAVGSLTTAVMAIVRPVDPLRPHSAPPLTPAQQKAVHLSTLPPLTKTPPKVGGPTGRLAGYPH